jgi:hypothetical protein
MVKGIKIILLPLLIISILVLFSFYGCGGGTTTYPWAGTPPENLTQQQIQQMLADSIDNYEKLNTYQLDINTYIATNVTGGANPWKTTMNNKVIGGKNIESDQIHLLQEMTVAMEGQGQNGEVQTLDRDMYVVNNYLYMNMSLTGMGEQWFKLPLSDKLREFLGFSAVDQEMGILESPAKVEYLGIEQLNGIDCYVLSISPGADELAQWLGEQDTSFTNVDWRALANDSNVYNNFSLLCYLTKDSNLFMKMTIEMAIELNAQQAGAADSDYDKVQMYLYMDMNLYDHDQPYSVTLPPGASFAKLVSEDIFFN